MSTQTSTDVDPVRSGFETLAAGDLDGFAAAFQSDATWNHRNDDRHGGVKAGIPAILTFIGESMKLSAGTLRAVPLTFMPDGNGCVAVLMHNTAARPDGRTLDDSQVLLFRVDGGLIASVDQFVGDPAAVTAFWA